MNNRSKYKIYTLICSIKQRSSNISDISEEDKAVSYLFQVTAGLESMVLGEDQILGQVKDALDFSRTMGFSKKELNKVVRDAITCAKKVKTTLE